MSTPDGLTVVRGAAPLVVSLPHTGLELPGEIERDLVSPWLARKDCDWWIDRLYDFAIGLGASVVHTSVSRTAIDVNRDPSGASLYPGQATTELCPTTSFDGEPLYRPGRAPDPAARRAAWFDPYHAALAGEIAAARAHHPVVVLYDCHSIRSVIPRLFEGTLPHFNIGTNGGASCSPALQTQIESICDGTGLTRVSNGRFKGGWITRHYAAPAQGVHAVQMELACRAYMAEPIGPVDDGNWPAPYDPAIAAPVRAALVRILEACISFARTHA
ncbi:MAG TPA: N-formylglutamate deformylase [Xanthobacteraceae bacterium]|nr:N-formylglutamate deformylase [Xanthobacteraceae bacterium]